MRHKQSSSSIDAALRHMAAGQLGLVTVKQAIHAGIDTDALARRRVAGALVEVFHGVLRIATVPTSPPQRVLAAALAVPGSVVAATSAAVVHGLPVASSTTEVVAVASSRIVRIVGIGAIRQTVVLPSSRWMTVRVATPAASLVLLPRFADIAIVERCLDHALMHGLTSVRTVRDLVMRIPTRAVAGRRLLLGLLDDRSGRTGHRSMKEQSVGRWLNAAGLHGWRSNHRVAVGNDEYVEADFAWLHDRVDLEVSPFFTHGSRRQQERDATRRRRLAGVGWRVVEATDADLADSCSFAATISALRALGVGCRAA